MGVFKNGIVSVQSFYYETKYAHNHYIESLVETGVVDLILFVGALVTDLIAVIKFHWKPEEESNSLTASLKGTLIFIAGHAAVEIVFSYYAYLPLAFGVFGLIALLMCSAVCRPALRQRRFSLKRPSLRRSCRRWIPAPFHSIWCNLF